LPFVSPIFRYDGLGLLDGGTGAPIPVGRSIEHGNTRHVVVLTRPQGYRKSPEALSGLSGLFYPGRPALVQALQARHEVYNAALAGLESMEEAGTALVFRPSRRMKVGRTTRDQTLLTGLYELGRDDARMREGEVKAFIDGV
jgi:predicted patatin/cPLA2 family phospholipase